MRTQTQLTQKTHVLLWQNFPVPVVAETEVDQVLWIPVPVAEENRTGLMVNRCLDPYD
jgi:hypothetical protein